MTTITTGQLPQKNTFTFRTTFTNGLTNDVAFDSDFDSGNCSEVKQNGPYNYEIYTANDCAGLETPGYTKSWFYFSVQGIPQGFTINFTIWRINMLYPLRKYPGVYKPVFKISNGEWQRTEEPANLEVKPEAGYILLIDEKLAVIFPHTFNCSPKEKTFFAFSYPFSYEEKEDLVQKLQTQYQGDPDIYFHREVLIRTNEKRNIDLITISSHEGKLKERESVIKDCLFPNKAMWGRAFKFRINKPVVLLTARVHPGETPASHAMNGILDFLLNKEDARSHLLRKFFVFLIVPMINPDGVFNGYYRMDTYNQNLNRHYNGPKITRQPSIFAIRTLVEYLKIENRLFFYCDLHAHSAKKGSFLFGNAMDDLTKQVESQLYAKMVDLNCVNFHYDSCIFSKKHMMARDRFEKLTKEGCGRVVIHRMCKIIHSYTLECGFHLSSVKNKIVQPAQKENLYNGKYNLQKDSLDDINNSYYKTENTHYTKEVYNNVGRALLISLLDIFEKNPYSRISNTPYQNLSNLRKEIAKDIMKLSRFRRNFKNYQKFKKIDEMAYEIFYQEFQKKKVFETPDSKPSLKPSFLSCFRKPPSLRNHSLPRQSSSNTVADSTPSKKKRRIVGNFDSDLSDFDKEEENNQESDSDAECFSEEMDDEREEEENKENAMVRKKKNIGKALKSKNYLSESSKWKNQLLPSFKFSPKQPKKEVLQLQSVDLNYKPDNEKKGFLLQGKYEWRLPKLNNGLLEKKKAKEKKIDALEKPKKSNLYAYEIK